jgi:hypothetical protein
MKAPLIGVEMKNGRVLRLVLAGLLASLVVPVIAMSSSHANPPSTITKSFTVTNPDGTAYAGALVQIYYWDGLDHYPTPQVTDASGHASVTVPYGVNYIQWEVEPKAGDTANAIAVADNSTGDVGQNVYVNENVSVHLKTATMKVALYLADGTTAAPVNYSNIQVPTNVNGMSSNGFWQLRTGSFGVYIPNDLSTTNPHQLSVGWNTDSTDTNELPKIYGLQVNGPSGGETFGLYTDTSNTSTLSPDGQGVYHLQLNKGDIQGQVKSNTGDNLSVEQDGLSAVTFYSVNSDGSNGKVYSASGISSSGMFYANLAGAPAGEYAITIQVANSLTVPFFQRNFWIDSSGKYSLSKLGSYSAGSITSPFSFTTNAPLPNFVFKYVKSDGVTPDSAGSNVWQNDSPFNENFTISGQGSLILPDGQYQLNFNPNNQLEATSLYNLSISGGVATVSNQADNSKVIPDSGIFTLMSQVANFRVQTVDATSGLPIPNTQININIRDANGNAIAGVAGNQTDTYSGISSFYLPQGQYTMQSWNSPDYSAVTSSFDVDSNGNVTFPGHTLNSTYKAYSIVQPQSNFKFYMPGGHSNGQFNEWYEICQGTTLDNCTNRFGNGTDPSLTAGATLATGTYFLTVHPYSDSLAAGTWQVNVASDGTVTVPGSTKNNGIWTTPGHAANVWFEVRNPTDNSLFGPGYINICPTTNANCLPNADFGTDYMGLTQAYVPDGTYHVNVNAQDSSLGLTQRSYLLTVTTGVATLTNNGSPVAKNGTRFLVGPSKSNFSFKMIDPTTNNPITDGWADICVDSGNGPNQTGDCNGSGVDQSGTGSANLTSGNWYLRVNPGASSAAASAIYPVTVDSNGNVTVTGVTAPSQGNPWLLPATTPNISGHLISNGSNISITPNSNQGVSVTLQEMDSNGNWQWVGNGNWKQSSYYGLKISSASDVTHTNHYRILAQPQNLANLSNSASTEFWLTSNGALSLSPDGSNSVNTLSNFDITLQSPNLNFEIKNPIDGSDLPSGWVTIQKVNTQSNSTTWVDNANISNNGLATEYLSDGTYQLQVNPQIGPSLISGLATNSYQAVVSNNGSTIAITHIGDGVAVTKNGSGVFVIQAQLANITGQITAADGSALVPGSNQWVNMNLQYKDANGNWQYSQNWYNTDQNGNFSLSENASGIYRLLIQPNGFTNATTFYSPSFTITSANAATFKENFGKLAAPAPDLVVQVLAPNGNTPLQNININVLQNNNWLSNSFTGSSATASLSFAAAGTYQLQLFPDNNSISQGYTQKTYSATVAIDSSGHKSVSFSSDPGVGTGTGGAVSLTLGSATIRGTVTNPSPDTSTVQNSQVVPFDSNDNGLWQYSSQTTSSGQWAMNLPQGTYTIQAQPPYGDITHGTSNKLGSITVNAQGVATLSGSLANATTSNIQIALKNPTWSGVVEAPSPSTTPVPYAQVCLNTFGNNFNCVQSDAIGRWAMSAPQNFSAFDANSQLRVQDNQGQVYAQFFAQGATAVSSALGGTSNNSVVVHLSNPNLTVHVLAGGEPAGNLNVNLFTNALNNNQWLANAQTDANGVAGFSVQNLNQPLSTSVDTSGNPNYSSTYSFTTQTLAATTDATESVTVNLATPNIRGIVHAQPTGAALGAVIPNEWVELDTLDNQGNRSWLGSTGADNNGEFSFFAQGSTTSKYAILIHANQGGTTNGSDNVYEATLTNGDVSSMYVSGTTTTTPTEIINNHSYYDFSLASPNVVGTVLDPSNAPIMNSWIQPFNTLTRTWLNSPNSDASGAFGLALANGTYQLQANPPGNSSAYAKSSICQVVIASGQATNVSAGCNSSGQSLGTINLKLHSPNLTFTLISGSTPVPNANVSFNLGGWNTWANSDSNGLVSLYIDSADIALLNPTRSGALPLSVYFNPPQGQSNLMVNSNCQSGQANTPCQNIPQVTIGSPFNSGNALLLGNVAVQGPNTHLQIKTPVGAPVGPGYWINLESFDTSTAQNFKYYGGASTDSNGIAWFNIDTSTATANTVFGVTINPSGNDSQNYTTGYVGDYQQFGDWLHGLSWNQLIAPSTLLAPTTPNASITVTSGDGGTADRYGWVSIQKLNSLGNIVSGTGVGLNYEGFSSLMLSGNSTYRIVAYPNGVAGAPTTCTVTTNTSNPVGISSAPECILGTNNALTITLSLGNVHGVVVGPDNTTPLSGAIVIAEVGSDTSTVVTTSTASNGAFGFNLDATKQYTITVISPVLQAYPAVNKPMTAAGTSGAEINLQTITMGN